MKKYQEVEAKYMLFNTEEVRKRLEELKAEHSTIDEIQRDTYYVPFHRNFLENDIISEWLRIRETNENCSINYKQWLPIGEKIQNHCNEYETIISDSIAMHKILEKLDFCRIVTVEKTRNSWVLDKTEISIDVVKGLGSFIELEALEILDYQEIDGCFIHFSNILQNIGAETGPRDRRGYPYLLIEKMRKRGN